LARLANKKQEKTMIYYGNENTANALTRVLTNTKRTWDVCADFIAPSVIVEIEIYKKAVYNAYKKGVKIRYVFEFTSENLRYCKELMNIAEVRHLDGIKGNFGISDETEYLATATLKRAKPMTQLIYSNVAELIEQQKYVFETLWSKAIPAEQRIIEIEKETSLGRTEIVQDSHQTKKKFFDLVTSAKFEVLLILPTANAYLRHERMGMLTLLVQKARENHIKVRVLTPTSKDIENLLQKLEVQEENKGRGIEENFIVRQVELESEIKSTILLVDRKTCLTAELIDDLKENFVEAIGSSTYSSSIPTVLSYVSIFESLWKQVELHELLKANDKMQKEFINIAAHELRTPIEPLLLGTQSLKRKYPNEERLSLLIRNAKRLQRLTMNILDVTRIESKSLSLKKEKINLSNIIRDTLAEYRSQIMKLDDNVKVEFRCTDDFIVEGDKERLSQVISNFLSNALKFTQKGRIVISARREQKDNNVIVSIIDTGTGINPKIFPNLFSKFATESFEGMGLGLYISKSIIQAHSGKIWAKNNDDGRGATFSFSLPLAQP
jgi:two-component system, OmpR family, sensor histidine kinase VicK